MNINIKYFFIKVSCELYFALKHWNDLLSIDLSSAIRFTFACEQAFTVIERPGIRMPVLPLLP